MVRVSNFFVGVLNMVTLALSVMILGGGIWLARRGNSECLRFLDKYLIGIGVILLVVSLAGFVGACCRVSWLMWVYLCVVFLLIVVLFGITIFAFVVTNKGAGTVLSNRGYKEYRLGDYSNWLQKRINQHWNGIQTCLIDGKVCHSLAEETNSTYELFIKEHLSAIQSGCCKPADSCGFEYVSPTHWNKPANSTSTDADCIAWNNDPNKLCFGCQSCKAGVIDNIKRDWKKIAILCIIVLIALIVVYSIGCCAFRNNRRDNAYQPSYKAYP